MRTRLGHETDASTIREGARVIVISMFDLQFRAQVSKQCVCLLVAQSCLTLWPHGLWPARLLCPLNSPGKNT